MQKTASVKFYLSLLLSLGGLILILYGVYLFFQNYISEQFSLETNILPVCFISGGTMLIIYMKSIRIQARQDKDYDQYGNKIQGYKNLSDKERRKIDLISMAENESILPSSEFNAMLHKTYDFPEEELEKLIGLYDVKQKILELKAKMKYESKNERNAFHMCFLGNPGTGKTTVAKILASFLVEYKYIKKNEIIITDAATILACSNPVKKMMLLLQKSHHRVLFIDEAYAFAFDKTGIGQECLSLLLNQIENSRTNMTIIIAGYKKEMKMLFDMNSGLQSRINTYLFFKDYDQFEMKEIFDKLAKSKKIKINENANGKLIKFFIWQKLQPTFANARTVRKIFENAMAKHYYNLEVGIIKKNNKNILCEEDICESNEEDFF